MVGVCNNYPQLIKYAEQSTINVGISFFRFAHGGAQQPAVPSPSNPHDYLTLMFTIVRAFMITHACTFMIMFTSMFMIVLQSGIAKGYCKR